MLSFSSNYLVEEVDVEKGYGVATIDEHTFSSVAMSLYDWYYEDEPIVAKVDGYYTSVYLDKEEDFRTIRLTGEYEGTLPDEKIVYFPTNQEKWKELTLQDGL